MSEKIIYHSLNTLKGLACLGVVWMHCCFPGVTGKLVIYAFKWNVPCFFMISGFFLYAAQQEAVAGKIVRQLPKIMRLGLIAFFLYALLCGSLAVISGEGLAHWSSVIFDSQRLLHKLFFGFFFNGTLWYLYALFWAYIVLWVLVRLFDLRKLLWLIPVILLLHYGLRIVLLRSGYDALYVTYFRSFAGFALPFMLSGYAMACYREKVVTCLKSWQWALVALAGFVMQLAEYALWGMTLDFYIGTVLFSYALFAICLQHPEQSFSKVLNYIGTKLSMPLYIVHLGIIMVMGFCWNGSAWLSPWLAVGIGLLVALLWNWVANLLTSDL